MKIGVFHAWVDFWFLFFFGALSWAVIVFTTLCYMGIL